MRKKKWKKVIIWVASIIIILGIGGLFAANYAVDKLISTLAANLESELLSEEPIEGDTEVRTVEPAEKPTAIDKPANTDTETTEPDKVVSSTTGNEQHEETKQPSKSIDGYSAEVSVDKAKDLQEKITVAEKAQLTSVFLKELSVSDIKELQGLASGGMSVEEKKEARSIILDKLSPEQYDELIQVAKKYGMSQGKSYDEVIKE